MSTCIDAEYKSEERYAKLSLAYKGDEQHQQIEVAINECTPLCELTPNIYTSDISNGRKVIVIEYQDVTDRTAGEVFENIMKKLQITECN